MLTKSVVIVNISCHDILGTWTVAKNENVVSLVDNRARDGVLAARAVGYNRWVWYIRCSLQAIKVCIHICWGSFRNISFGQEETHSNHSFYSSLFTFFAAVFGMSLACTLCTLRWDKPLFTAAVSTSATGPSTSLDAAGVIASSEASVFVAIWMKSVFEMQMTSKEKAWMASFDQEVSSVTLLWWRLSRSTIAPRFFSCANINAVRPSCASCRFRGSGALIRDANERIT